MTVALNDADAAQMFRDGMAEEIRALMGRRRISIRTLASRAGMATSTLSRKLAAAYPFDTDELVRIAGVLGVGFAALCPQQDSNLRHTVYNAADRFAARGRTVSAGPGIVVPFRRRPRRKNVGVVQTNDVA